MSTNITIIRHAPTKYNEQFCQKYRIPIKYYNASHSLYETIDNVSQDVMDFFKS